MVLARMRSPRPPAAVRAMLAAEVVGYVAALTAYVQLALPPDGHVRLWDVAFYVFAAAFPIAMNLLHGDRPRDSGIRLDNLLSAGRSAAVATAILAAGIVAIGLTARSFHWTRWGHFFERAGMYLAWGPMQQYLLQAFALRRLRQAGLATPLAVVAASAAFGLVHAPNWLLVGLTFGSGIVFCRLFLRRPNLVPLGIAHGILAVLLYFAWPTSWHLRLAIGGMVPG